MLIEPSGKRQVGIEEDWTSDHTEIIGYRHVTISRQQRVEAATP